MSYRASKSRAKEALAAILVAIFLVWFGIPSEWSLGLKILDALYKPMIDNIPEDAPQDYRDTLMQTYNSLYRTFRIAPWPLLLIEFIILIIFLRQHLR